MSTDAATKDVPWAGYVIRAHLPRMTEADVRECIADGRMNHLLGRNCSFVMFPQRTTRDGGPDIRPVDYHNADGIPVVAGGAANLQGTWIPLGPSVLVRTYLKVPTVRRWELSGARWSLPLTPAQRIKVKNNKAQIVCPDSKYNLLG